MNSRTILTMTVVIAMFSNSAAFSADMPDKINLTRTFAVLMAINKNAELRIEALNPTIAEADAAGSRGIYNPLMTARVSGGGYTYPFQARMTTTGAGSVGITQTLPSGGAITLYTDTNYYRDPSVIDKSADWTSNAGIVLSQPLLKNAGKEKTEAGIIQAGNSLKESQQRYLFSAIDTVFATIASYNNLYTVRQLLESRTTSIKATQTLLDELRRKRRGGTTAQQKIEIANAEYSLAQRRKEMIDADRRVRDQEANLRYLIGIEDRTQLIPIEAPSREEPQDSEEQSVKKALELRTDLKQLQVALESSRLQERVSRNLTRPDLTLSASGAFDGTGASLGTSYRELGNGKGTAWAAGLQFSMPLGNTTAASEYRKSQIRTEQLQQQIRMLSWKIRNDVEADERALISARLQLQTTQQSLAYAEVRHTEYLKNNLAGTATVQDVINAENDFSSARTAHFEALETFANAVEKLWRDTGELLDRHGLKIAETGKS